MRLWSMRHSFSMQNFSEAFLATRGAGSDDGGSRSWPLLSALLVEGQKPVVRLLARLPDALLWVSIRTRTGDTWVRRGGGDSSMVGMYRPGNNDDAHPCHCLCPLAHNASTIFCLQWELLLEELGPHREVSCLFHDILEQGYKMYVSRWSQGRRTLSHR